MLANDPWRGQPWQAWVVVARGGEGEIGWTSEHNDIIFSNATIVATYKVFLFEERQKRPLIIATKISSFGSTFWGQHSLIRHPHLAINFACGWRNKHILEIANNGDAFLFDVSCMKRLGFVASVDMLFFLILTWKNSWNDAMLLFLEYYERFHGIDDDMVILGLFH